MSCSQDEINKQVEAKVNAAIAEKIKNSETVLANERMMAMMRSMSGKDSAAMQSMFQNMSSMLTCDTACQRRKKADELRNAWKAAVETEKTAPITTAEAEKRYYVFTEGTPGYEKMLLQRYTKKAETAKGLALKTLKRMKELLRVRLDENKALKAAIDQDIAAVETNDRRVVYENWAKGWLGTVGKALLWLYILVAATFIYKSSFIQDQGYKTVKGWLMVVALVIYPFILKYISLLIWFLTDQVRWYLQNRAPRDVFTSDNM